MYSFSVTTTNLKLYSKTKQINGTSNNKITKRDIQVYVYKINKHKTNHENSYKVRNIETNVYNKAESIYFPHSIV